MYDKVYKDVYEQCLVVNDLLVYKDDFAVIREQRLLTAGSVIGVDRSTGSVVFFFRVVGLC